MIPELGHFALTLALFVACAQTIPLLSRRAAALQFGLGAAALLALLWSALTLDFTVTLVAENAHTLKPFYRNVGDVMTSPGGFGLMLLVVLAARGAMIARKNYPPLVLRGFAAMNILLIALLLFLAAPFARIYPPPFDGVAYDPFAKTSPAERPSLIGANLPPFTAGTFSSADIEGPAVISFFASWCPPCEAEWPVLQSLSASGVRIYGIAFKDDAKDTEAFLKRLGNPYTRTGADPDGEVGGAFAVPGLPTSFVVDAKGIIRYRHDAPLTGKDAAEIKELLR